MREAARRAGVSHNAPYRHFADREALLEALVAEGFEQLNKGLENRAGRQLGEAYVAFALAHPERFRLMFAGGRTNADLEAQFAKSFAHLGADAAVAGAAAWSLVHGLALLILAGRLDYTPLRVAGQSDDDKMARWRRPKPDHLHCCNPEARRRVSAPSRRRRPTVTLRSAEGSSLHHPTVVEACW